MFYLAGESNNNSNKMIHVTDGTKSGTKILYTTNLSNIKNLNNSNGELLFTAVDDKNEIQIYKITNDLVIEKLSNFSGNPIISKATNYKGSYYVFTVDYSDYPEIKKCTNGHCDTFLKYKKTINSNFDSFVFDDRLYFGYTDKDLYEVNNELYSTDGTLENTIKVDTNGQNIYLLDTKLKYIDFKNNIYFIGNDLIDGQYGSALFKLENNKLIKLYRSYNIYSDLVSSGNNIYFLGNNFEDYSNVKLIKSDGTVNGTSVVDETYIYSNTLGIINNNVYYQKFDEENGGELWTYDENLNINKLVRNINYTNSGEVVDMTPINNKIFFKGNLNKSYSTTGFEIENHPTSFENDSYGSQSFVESGDNVISVSSNSEKHVYSILNDDSHVFEPFVTVNHGFEGFPHLIQTIGDNVYFKSTYINDPNQYLNSQLNYFNKKTKEVDVVKKIDNTFIEKLGSNYTGLYEYNGNYYYATDGNNKGIILQLNPITNTTSEVYRFKPGIYDSDQAFFVGKFNGKLVVEQANKLYYFDGNKMTKFADGKGVKLYEPKKIDQNNYATINNKLLFLKPTNEYYIFELWSTDGVNEEYLNLNVNEKLMSFQKCNNKFYFVAGKSLIETDGSKIGTKFVDIMDHDYNYSFTSIKCYKDNLFYVGDYYGSKINVINGDENKSFDIKFKELPDLILDLSYVYDMEIVNDKLFLNMYHHYAGKEVFVTDYKNFNLTSLSINDNATNVKVDKVIVYPNPFNNEFFIKGNVNEVLKELKLYDLTGKLIFVKKVNKQEIKISTEFLKKGIYFLQIITITLIN